MADYIATHPSGRRLRRERTASVSSASHLQAFGFSSAVASKENGSWNRWGGRVTPAAASVRRLERGLRELAPRPEPEEHALANPRAGIGSTACNHA